MVKVLVEKNRDSLWAMQLKALNDLTGIVYGHMTWVIWATAKKGGLKEKKAHNPVDLVGFIRECFHAAWWYKARIANWQHTTRYNVWDHLSPWESYKVFHQDVAKCLPTISNLIRREKRKIEKYFTLSAFSWACMYHAYITHCPDTLGSDIMISYDVTSFKRRGHSLW